jgi:hypothetical protein
MYRKFRFGTRLWVSRQVGILLLDTWDSELTDTSPDVRSIREWAASHLSDGYTPGDLCDLLRLPVDESVYEVVFTGALAGDYDDLTGEWDESLDVEWSVFQVLPDDFLKTEFGDSL